MGAFCFCSATSAAAATGLPGTSRAALQVELEDAHRRRDLPVLARQDVAQQKPRPRPFEPDVPCGNPQARLGPHLSGQQHQASLPHSPPLLAKMNRRSVKRPQPRHQQIDKARILVRKTVVILAPDV